MPNSITETLTERNNEFIEDLLDIPSSEKNTLDMELAMFHRVMKFACDVIGTLFEQMDADLYESARKQGYEVERRDERSINFLFGMVTFKRRRIRKPGEKGFYLLDRELGFPKGKRFSGGVIKAIGELSTTMVTRAVANAVQLLTSLTVSHQTVTSLIHYLGKAAVEYADEVAEGNIKDKEPSNATVLAVEGDGLVLKSKNKSKKELHRIQIYENVAEKGLNKPRRVLVHARFFADIDKKALRERVEKYLDNHFHLGKLTVLSNGDGGFGYDEESFHLMCWASHEHKHVRDDFHVNKKIRVRLSFCPKKFVDSMIRELRTLTSEKEIQERIPPWMDTARSYIREDSRERDLEQIEKLRAYLERNASCLKSLINLETKVDIRLGTAESNHRIYSYRMKRQGRSWSESGMNAMAGLITARKNGELGKSLLYGIKNQYIQRIQEEVATVAVNIRERVGVKSKYHSGAIEGRIGVYGPSSSPLGALARGLNRG